MSEIFIVTVAFIELIVLAIGCWCYMWGGRSGKWKRRFIGSLICSTAVWVGLLLMNRFSYWSLLIYPILAIGFSLGYGSDIEYEKFFKRLIIVVTICGAGLILTFILKGSSIYILPLQLLIACGSIWLGLKNPIQAAAEEFFACLS